MFVSAVSRFKIRRAPSCCQSIIFVSRDCSHFVLSFGLVYSNTAEASCPDGSISVTVELELSYGDGNGGNGYIDDAVTNPIGPEPDDFGSLWTTEVCLAPGAHTFYFDQSTEQIEGVFSWFGELTYAVKDTATGEMLHLVIRDCYYQRHF